MGAAIGPAGEEIVGNIINPKVHLKIQYCGGWNYKPYADRLKAELDKDEWFSTAIQYHLFKDEGVTGNFEVHAFKK